MRQRVLRRGLGRVIRGRIRIVIILDLVKGREVIRAGRRVDLDLRVRGRSRRISFTGHPIDMVLDSPTEILLQWQINQDYDYAHVHGNTLMGLMLGADCPALSTTSRSPLFSQFVRNHSGWVKETELNLLAAIYVVNFYRM